MPIHVPGPFGSGIISTLTAIATLSTAPIAAAASEPPALERYTSAFALEDHGDAGSTLVVLDLAGKEIGRRELHDRGALFGPDHAALIAIRADGDERRVDLIDRTNAAAASFTIPGDRALTIGAASLALTPVEEHQVGTPLDLEFRSFPGGVLARFAEPDLRLCDLEPEPGGQWLALAVDSAASFQLLAFDANGGLRWSVACPSTHLAPVFAMTSSGARTVIGTDGTDDHAMTVTILDGNGREVTTRATSPFAQVVFDGAELEAALVGRGAITLLELSDGGVLATSDVDRRVLLGASSAFDADGERLFVMTRDVHLDGGAMVRLHVFSSVANGFRERVKDVPEAGSADNVRVLALIPFNDAGEHGLRVVTNVGQWSVKP